MRILLYLFNFDHWSRRSSLFVICYDYVNNLRYESCGTFVVTKAEAKFRYNPNYYYYYYSENMSRANSTFAIDVNELFNS